MIKISLLAGVITLVLTFLCGKITIPFLRKIKAGQPILFYVKEHKEKSGTPTMGGLFFILPPIVIYAIFNGFSYRISNVVIAVTLAFLCVGFLDDFIKVKYKHNQGLKAYQKIIFQFGIALFSGIFAYKNNLTYFYLPFVKSSINLGVFTIPFVAITFIAITNSVNLTDGLDGLASWTSLVYLIFLCVLIILEFKIFSLSSILNDEYNALILLTFCMIFAILAFLIFNSGKASVFMGDTGSLALGGFIGAVSIFSSNALFIPILGVIFVFSSVSVIIQVISFKSRKKRVFLMTPFHHHLQLKGKTETQISYYYSLITCISGVVSIIFYL